MAGPSRLGAEAGSFANRKPFRERLCAAALIAAFVAATACADGTVSSMTVVDSAGVSIRTSAVTPEGIPSFAVERPVLTLGRLEGEGPDVFGSVPQVMLDENRLIVIDGAARQIEAFNLDGAHLTGVGRRGDGPGEYNFPVILEATGDSILVWDARDQRISVFEATGRFARSLQLQGGQRFGELRRSGAGYVGSRTLPPVGPPQSTDGLVLKRDSTQWARFSGAGVLERELFAVPGRELLESVTVLEGGLVQSRQASLPFFRSSHFAAQGSDLIGGPNDRAELRRWSSAGELLAIYRYPGLESPITPADLDAWDGDLSAWLEYLPDMAPAFTGLEVSDDGSIWLREFGLRDAESWLVLNAETGDLLGRVAFPARFRLLSVVGRRAGGVWQDELDVSFVHVYSVPTGLRAGADSP